jgi:hypothetical protein
MVNALFIHVFLPVVAAALTCGSVKAGYRTAQCCGKSDTTYLINVDPASEQDAHGCAHTLYNWFDAYSAADPMQYKYFNFALEPVQNTTQFAVAYGASSVTNAKGLVANFNYEKSVPLSLEVSKGADRVFKLDAKFARLNTSGVAIEGMDDLAITLTCLRAPKTPDTYGTYQLMRPQWDDPSVANSIEFSEGLHNERGYQSYLKDPVRAGDYYLILFQDDCDHSHPVRDWGQGSQGVASGRTDAVTISGPRWDAKQNSTGPGGQWASGPTFDHGECGATYVAKYHAATSALLSVHSLEEIAATFDGVSPNEDFPKPIEYKYCATAPDSGACAGMRLGRMVTTKGPIVATQDGTHFFGYDGSSTSPSMFKVRVSDMKLVWWQSIEPATIGETQVKGMFRIPPIDASSSDPRKSGERFVFYSSAHMVGYESNIPWSSTGNNEVGMWGRFDEAHGKVFCLVDGETPSILWTFHSGPETLKEGDVLPEEVFVPGEDAYRIWVSAAAYIGQTISTGSSSESPMVPGVAGIHPVIVGPETYSGVETYTIAQSYLDKSLYSKNMRRGFPFSSDTTEFNFMRAMSGFIHIPEGTLFSESSCFTIYEDSKATIPVLLPEATPDMASDARVTLNAFEARVEADEGLRLNSVGGGKQVQVCASYLAERHLSLLTTLHRSSVGKHNLTKYEAAGLNYATGGFWGDMGYDEATDTIYAINGNGYAMPAEDQIRLARMSAAELRTDSPSTWVDADLGTVEDLVVPPDLGAYQAETDVYYKMYFRDIKGCNAGEKWQTVRSFGGCPEGSDHHAMYQLKNMSFANDMIAKYTDRAITHEDAARFRHLQRRLMDVKQSPRSRRAGFDTVFGIRASDGALKMTSKINPYDVTINQHTDWYIAPAEIYQFVRGQNNDGIVATVCAEQRRLFATAQAFGTTVVFDLDSNPTLECSEGSDVSCRRGIASDSTVVQHLYGDDPSSLYDDWSSTFSGTSKCGSTFYVEGSTKPGISFVNAVTHDWNNGNPVPHSGNLTSRLTGDLSLVEVGGRTGVRSSKTILRLSKGGIHVWDTFTEAASGQLRNMMILPKDRIFFQTSTVVRIVNYINGDVYYRDDAKARGVIMDRNALVITTVGGAIVMSPSISTMNLPLPPPVACFDDDVFVVQESGGFTCAQIASARLCDFDPRLPVACSCSC